MLEQAERAPAVAGTSFDGRTIELAKPGRRTVLWFSPKGGRIDELTDRLGARNP